MMNPPLVTFPMLQAPGPGNARLAAGWLDRKALQLFGPYMCLPAREAAPSAGSTLSADLNAFGVGSSETVQDKAAVTADS